MNEEQANELLERMKSIEELLIAILVVQPSRVEIINQKLATFGDSKRRAEIYLLIDGETSGAKIAETLGMEPSNVSTTLKDLQKEGLAIQVAPSQKAPYRRTAIFETLGLPELVSQHFNIQ